MDYAITQLKQKSYQNRKDSKITRGSTIKHGEIHPSQQAESDDTKNAPAYVKQESDKAINDAETRKLKKVLRGCLERKIKSKLRDKKK